MQGDLLPDRQTGTVCAQNYGQKSSGRLAIDPAWNSLSSGRFMAFPRMLSVATGIRAFPKHQASRTSNCDGAFITFSFKSPLGVPWGHNGNSFQPTREEERD
ncbi:hypothetical protein TNCV_4670901 [Trichonephila clavipes]|nr:hypothetical protein TNCV_4670901 [Trichonephila clavipes]